MIPVTPAQAKPSRFATDSRAWSPRVRCEVVEMLMECLRSGTQCEDADIDEEFNHAVEHLLIFADRPNELIGPEDPPGLASLQRYAMSSEGVGISPSADGQFVRFQDAANAIHLSGLKVSVSDFSYDSDRASWHRREANLLALIGAPSTQPIHQWREDADELWEDCSTEQAEAANAKGYEVRTVYPMPEDDVRAAVEKENADLRLQCGGMEIEIAQLRSEVAQLHHQLTEIDSGGIQGVEAVAKCGRGRHASFCQLTDYGRQVMPDGSNSLYLASQLTNGVLVIPVNLLSHRNSWRSAFERLIELEPERQAPGRNDRFFWRHEMQAMDHMYQDLDRIVAEQKLQPA
ncbi:TPA: hypothetical protein ACP32N_005035 [Pseudomonas aeruginosa]